MVYLIQNNILESLFSRTIDKVKGCRMPPKRYQTHRVDFVILITTAP